MACRHYFACPLVSSSTSSNEEIEEIHSRVNRGVIHLFNSVALQNPQISSSDGEISPDVGEHIVNSMDPNNGFLFGVNVRPANPFNFPAPQPNQLVIDFNQPAPQLNQLAPNLNQPPHQPAPNANEPAPNIDQPAPHPNEQAPNVDQALLPNFCCSNSAAYSTLQMMDNGQEISNIIFILVHGPNPNQRICSLRYQAIRYFATISFLDLDEQDMIILLQMPHPVNRFHIASSYNNIHVFSTDNYETVENILNDML